ncbi:MAG: hypothetical protein ACE5H9_17485 [Anaerolineae bacterium]
MIKPFRLRDMRLVARLQRNGVSLDLEEQLTHPRSPLRSALLTSVFLPGRGPFTFILDYQEDSTQYLGLAQMRPRPGRPEVDVVFIAPALDSGNGSHALWQRMLTHLCVRTGEWGGQRIYTRLSPGGDAYQVFRNVGFVGYAQEEVFREGPDAPQPEVEPLVLRRQTARDSWDLQRLYAAVTPRAVQSAEGSAQGRWELAGRRWGEQGRRYGYVWESEGEVMAAVHIRSGKEGHWLKWLLHDDALDQADALVGASLRLVRSANNLPVYCGVRSYQSGLRGALERWGFCPLTTQTLMVKHIALRIREWSLAPSREVQAESVAPTAFVPSTTKTAAADPEKRKPPRHPSGLTALF